MSTTPWFPLFEFQDYIYESFLILPAAEEKAAPPGSAVTAKKWARGLLSCGQAFSIGDGAFELNGKLELRPGVTLSVSLKGIRGTGTAPATFSATGTGMEGPAKGSVYELSGWVFPVSNQLPDSGAARVLALRGSVRAVRGPDAKPDRELGGMPLGTVGSFVIDAFPEFSEEVQNVVRGWS